MEEFEEIYTTSVVQGTRSAVYKFEPLPTPQEIEERPRPYMVVVVCCFEIYQLTISISKLN